MITPNNPTERHGWLSSVVNDRYGYSHLVVKHRIKSVEKEIEIWPSGSSLTLNAQGARDFAELLLRWANTGTIAEPQ